jgi:O-antigen/teichoic acid export membrane protein
MVACALVLAVGGGLFAMYTVLAATYLSRLLAKLIIVRHVLGPTSLMPKLAFAGGMLHLSKWGWLHGIGGMFFGIGDRLLVGSMLGSESLVHYSVTTQLAMQVHGLTAAAISVVFPFISRMRASNASFSLARATQLIFFANIFLSSLLASALLLFGKKILTLWLGAQAADASTLKLLFYLTVAYWTLALNVTAHFVLMGLGRLRLIALSNLLGGTVSLGLMWWLAQSEGLVGVGIGRIAYGLITTMNFIPLIYQIRAEQRTLATRDLLGAPSENLKVGQSAKT